MLEIKPEKKGEKTYKHEKKTDNLAENVERFKVEISSLKQENKKLVNNQKYKTKKSQTVSTNPVPS